MTTSGRYLLGVVAVAALAGGMIALAPAGTRGQVVWGAGIGLILQAPLGWWVVRSIGTERFLVIWGLGLLARLTVVAIVGLGVVPVLGWSPGPALGALVGVLVALLFVEGITAWRDSMEEGRHQ